MSLEDRCCIICGKEFRPKKAEQRCCSAACANIQAHKTVKKYYTCQQCGKPFWKPNAFRMKYCSDKCRRTAYAEQHPKKDATTKKKKYRRNCSFCGQQFETNYPNQIYCGEDCCYKANLKQKREQWASAYIPRKYICKECGTEFTTECGDTHSVFCCQRCADKNERRKEHQTDRHKQYMKTMKHVREKQIAAAFVETVYYDAIFERDHGTCQICGLPVSVNAGREGRWSGTIDHIIPLSLGGEHSMNNCQLAHRVCNSLKCQSDGGFSIDWEQKAMEDRYWRNAYDEYRQQVRP